MENAIGRENQSLLIFLWLDLEKKMNDTRKYTNALSSAIEEGILDAEEILNLLASWLPESDVQGFVEDQDWEEILGFVEEEEESEEEEGEEK